jgi:hypothetical protein
MHREETVPTTTTDPNGDPITAKQVFETFVGTLIGHRDHRDELLVTKLRWFSEDVATAADRLAERPRAAVRIVLGLSTMMQDLDKEAGAVDAAQHSVENAHEAALMLEDSSVHD